MRTERGARSISICTNALASSIVLVCRTRVGGGFTYCDPPRFRHRAQDRSYPRPSPTSSAATSPPLTSLKPPSAPAWPSTRATPKSSTPRERPLSVRRRFGGSSTETLDEAARRAREGDFDADSRWALTWFEHAGFGEGEYGVAEQLSKSKNTSVAGMVEAGIVVSKRRSQVRLLKPEELPADWDPDDGPAPDQLGRQSITLMRPGSGQRSESAAGVSWSRSSAPRPRSHANFATASTPCASAKSGHPRRSPTTAWS